MTDSEVLGFVEGAKVNEVTADTADESASVDTSIVVSIPKLPQKRFFRQRAHANPFSDHLLE
jgi:hypothetical protein